MRRPGATCSHPSFRRSDRSTEADRRRTASSPRQEPQIYSCSLTTPASAAGEKLRGFEFYGPLKTHAPASCKRGLAALAHDSASPHGLVDVDGSDHADRQMSWLANRILKI